MVDQQTPEHAEPYDVVCSIVNTMAPKKKVPITASILLDDIGMDSLETLSLAMDLEERYQLYIPDEDIATFRDLKDIADYLESALQAREANTSNKEDAALNK